MAATPEEIERAWWNYDQALSKLARAKPSNGAGAEAAYGGAYKALVQLGEAPQLRGKYRVYTG